MFETYDDILSIEELASILKIGTTQAYKIVRSGKIKAFKEGKDWKISKQALINYIMEQSNL
ncbi:MAG: helix-turn-helix domain-containing protein [Lachnospiraceae bacterium]|nr:helix-turn-helix domain-containing protein [Lachnospiraceae bacterium]